MKILIELRYGILTLLFTIPAMCLAQSGLMETAMANYNGGAYGELIQGGDGLLYGASGGGDFGLGVIYKCNLDGSLTNLSSFNGTNGASPVMPMLPMPDGSFYGIAQGGGNGFNGASYSGLGTVFKLSSSGVLDAVVSFGGTNGANPMALILGSDGNFYGTTYFGGAFTNDPTSGYQGNGTVFKLSTDGQFTLLASFDGTNGEGPAKMIQANDGNFYGVTERGGNYGNGTVFQMTPDGTVSTMFSFNGTNGSIPITLIEGSDGFLYGTTDYGGNDFNGTDGSGDGTVFRISTNGDFTSLGSFNVSTTGGLPFGRLLEVSNGVFYGTTGFGGTSPGGFTSANGTLFQITTNGNLTVMVAFLGSLELPDYPAGGVIKASDGNFYGAGAQGLYCIRPIQAPLVQASGLGNQISLTWNAWAGYRYSLFSGTNLSLPFLGGNVISQTIPATNGTMSYSDPIGPDSQHFYRVVLQLR